MPRQEITIETPTDLFERGICVCHSCGRMHSIDYKYCESCNQKIIVITKNYDIMLDHFKKEDKVFVSIESVAKIMMIPYPDLLDAIDANVRLNESKQEVEQQWTIPAKLCAKWLASYTPYQEYNNFYTNKAICYGELLKIMN